MTMDTLQIRMNKELLKRIDVLVKSGVYSNRSDVIRDSVKLVRNTRDKLSKEKINLKEINNI